MALMRPETLIPVGKIEERVLLIRGQKVMLDADLAELYGVTTKRLNEQVRRNRARFPEDFVFQLTDEEAQFLRSQFATSKTGRGGRRYLPYAFTEHGAIMAASVLNTQRANPQNAARSGSGQENRRMTSRKELLFLRCFPHS